MLNGYPPEYAAIFLHRNESTIIFQISGYNIGHIESFIALMTNKKFKFYTYFHFYN